MEIKSMDKLRDLDGKYKVVARVYHGDGDLYQDEVLGYFDHNDDEDILEELLDLLDSMKRMNGRDYEDIDGFKKWFLQEDMDEDEYDAVDTRIRKLGNEWQRDMQSMQYGDDILVALDEYKVFYYEFGREYVVEFDRG